jgi:mycoredoxin
MTLKMYTTSWCSDCQITKAFLMRFAVPFEEINIEEHDWAADFVMQINGGRRSVPTLEFNGDATSLSGFSRTKLEAFLDKHQLKPSINL